jgi:hypothetical protein
MMNVEQLLAEGHWLARPCTWLVTDATTTPIAAIWGGPGILQPPAGPFEHRITVDCRYLPNPIPGVTGCLSVYQNTEQSEHGRVLLDPTRSLAPPFHGRVLYAQPTMALPPLEGIFRFGSPIVAAWLQMNGWQRDWEYNSNFPDRNVADAYNRIYQEHTPLYTQAATAVLGGWHFPWPDGDWDERHAQQLVLWTLEDAEPWLEVWHDSTSQLRLIERNT